MSNHTLPENGGTVQPRVHNSYRKSIGVRYLGATNYRPSRLVAEADGGNRVTVNYDVLHDEDHNARYARAAVALVQKMGWDGDLVQGGGVGPYCAVFVFLPTVEV